MHGFLSVSHDYIIINKLEVYSLSILKPNRSTAQRVTIVHIETSLLCADCPDE